jgi:hypothetical protein
MKALLFGAAAFLDDFLEIDLEATFLTEAFLETLFCAFGIFDCGRNLLLIIYIFIG